MILCLDKCIRFYFNLQIICQFILPFAMTKKNSAKHVQCRFGAILFFFYT